MLFTFKELRVTRKLSDLPEHIQVLYRKNFNPKYKKIELKHYHGVRARGFLSILEKNTLSKGIRPLVKTGFGEKFLEIDYNTNPNLEKDIAELFEYITVTKILSDYEAFDLLLDIVFYSLQTLNGFIRSSYFSTGFKLILISQVLVRYYNSRSKTEDRLKKILRSKSVHDFLIKQEDIYFQELILRKLSFLLIFYAFKNRNLELFRKVLDTKNLQYVIPFFYYYGRVPTFIKKEFMKNATKFPKPLAQSFFNEFVIRSNPNLFRKYQAIFLEIFLSKKLAVFDSKEVIITYLKKDRLHPNMFKYIPSYMLKDPEFIQDLIEEYTGSVIEFLDQEYLTPEIYKKALLKTPSCVKHIPKKCLDKHTLLKNVITKKSVACRRRLKGLK